MIQWLGVFHGSGSVIFYWIIALRNFLLRFFFWITMWINRKAHLPVRDKEKNKNKIVNPFTNRRLVTPNGEKKKKCYGKIIHLNYVLFFELWISFRMHGMPFTTVNIKNVWLQLYAHSKCGARQSFRAHFSSFFL